MAVLIDIEGRDGVAGSRAVVNQFRYKLRATGRFGVAGAAEGVQYGSTVGVGICVVIPMRPVALADDEIGNTIAIGVTHGGAVHFRNHDAARVLAGEIIDHHVLDERDLAGHFVAFLLEPGETPAMGLQDRNDIGEAVTIHVINPHLAATG